MGTFKVMQQKINKFDKSFLIPSSVLALILLKTLIDIHVPKLFYIFNVRKRLCVCRTVSGKLLLVEWAEKRSLCQKIRKNPENVDIQYQKDIPLNKTYMN